MERGRPPERLAWRADPARGSDCLSCARRGDSELPGRHTTPLCGRVLARGREILAQAEAGPPWDEVLQHAPAPHQWVPKSRVDALLDAFAGFIDLTSPFRPGHSREVAALLAKAAPDQAVIVRRAARAL